MYRQEFILPQCRVQMLVSEQLETNFVVAGGRRPDESWLRQAAAGCSLHCADVGGKYCLQAGLVPERLYGDGDSTDSEIYKKLAALGTRVFCYPPAKDDTDLQLLLQHLNASNIIVSGIWGGRFDHLYSNVFSLLGFKKHHGCQVLMADAREVMLLLSAAESARIKIKELQCVEAVSLLPLSDKARVNIDGVYWPLQESCLELLHPYAVSNIPLGDFSCDCLCGDIGLYLCFKDN